MAMRFDPASLAKFGRLALQARAIVEGFLQGIHRSPYKGFSVEFAEHRQYYPGDEIRHIDWRAFGKTDRFFIKEFEEETNLQAHLVVDASGSMAYAGSSSSKFAHAQQVAAALAYLMLHQLDAVGLVMHDQGVYTMIPPRAISKQLPRILQALEQARPGGETGLATVWHRLAGQLRRRSLVILLSDCFDPLPSLVHALRHLRHRGHEVILFHILAPEEIDFPFKLATRFRSLETPGLELLIDPWGDRQEYLKNFNDFRDRLRTRAGEMQVDYHRLRTDEPVDRALGLYLTRRLARRKSHA